MSVSIDHSALDARITDPTKINGENVDLAKSQYCIISYLKMAGIFQSGFSVGSKGLVIAILHGNKKNIDRAFQASVSTKKGKKRVWGFVHIKRFVQEGKVNPERFNLSLTQKLVTPLHLAAICSDNETLEKLLSLGCTPKVDSEGFLPHHHVARAGNIVALNILVRFAGNEYMECRNKRNATPMELFHLTHTAPYTYLPGYTPKNTSNSSSNGSKQEETEIGTKDDSLQKKMPEFPGVILKGVETERRLEVVMDPLSLIQDWCMPIPTSNCDNPELRKIYLDTVKGALPGKLLTLSNKEVVLTVSKKVDCMQPVCIQSGLVSYTSNGYIEVDERVFGGVSRGIVYGFPNVTKVALSDVHGLPLVKVYYAVGEIKSGDSIFCGYKNAEVPNSFWEEKQKDKVSAFLDFLEAPVRKVDRRKVTSRDRMEFATSMASRRIYRRGAVKRSRRQAGIPFLDNQRNSKELRIATNLESFLALLESYDRISKLDTKASFEFRVMLDKITYILTNPMHTIEAIRRGILTESNYYILNQSPYITNRLDFVKNSEQWINDVCGLFAILPKEVHKETMLFLEDEYKKHHDVCTVRTILVNSLMDLNQYYEEIGCQSSNRDFSELSEATKELIKSFFKSKLQSYRDEFQDIERLIELEVLLN